MALGACPAMASSDLRRLAGGRFHQVGTELGCLAQSNQLPNRLSRTGMSAHGGDRLHTRPGTEGIEQPWNPRRCTARCPSEAGLFQGQEDSGQRPSRRRRRCLPDRAVRTNGPGCRAGRPFQFSAIRNRVRQPENSRIIWNRGHMWSSGIASEVVPITARPVEKGRSALKPGSACGSFPPLACGRRSSGTRTEPVAHGACTLPAPAFQSLAVGGPTPSRPDRASGKMRTCRATRSSSRIDATWKSTSNWSEYRNNK